MIIYALIANAVAHVISYVKLKDNKTPYSVGVLAFVFVNILIAGLLWQNITWAKWFGLILTIIGCLGLLMTTIIKKKGTWIDYIILILDLLIIGLILKNYIL